MDLCTYVVALLVAQYVEWLTIYDHFLDFGGFMLGYEMIIHYISYISLNERTIHKCMIFLSIETTSTGCEFVSLCFDKIYSKLLFLAIIGVNGYVRPKTHWYALHGLHLPIVFQY